MILAWAFPPTSWKRCSSGSFRSPAMIAVAWAWVSTSPSASCAATVAGSGPRAPARAAPSASPSRSSPLLEGRHDVPREPPHRAQHLVLRDVAEPEAAVEVVDLHGFLQALDLLD